MRHNLMRRSITSILCAIFVVGGALAVFSFGLWAQRERRGGQRMSEAQFLQYAEAGFHRTRSTPLSSGSTGSISCS